MRATLLIMALLVSACTQESSLRPEHYVKANEECASRGGIEEIQKPSDKAEWLYCGEYCDKKTGRVQYTETVICKDGTKSDLTWFK